MQSEAVEMQNPSFLAVYKPFFHGGQEPQFNHCLLTGYLNGPADQFPTKMEMNAEARQKTRVLATDCGRITFNVELIVGHNNDVSILEYANGEQGLFDFQTFLACQRVISMKRSQDQLTELLKAPRKAKLSKAEKRAFGAVDSIVTESVEVGAVDSVVPPSVGTEHEVEEVVSSPKKARKSIVDE